MAQFAPDTSNLGTEVGSISFAALDMFCLIYKFLSAMQ